MNTQPAASVTRQLQTVFGISIFLLILSSTASYYANRQSVDAMDRVTHTQQVIGKTDELLAIIRDAESAQRGYIITSDAAFLPTYRGADERALARLQELTQLTSDNQTQQRNLLDLKVLVDERFGQMEATLGIVEGLDSESRATAFVTKASSFIPGRRTMQDLTAQIGVIKAEEQRLLNQRAERLDRFNTWTPVLMVVAAVLSVLISLLAFFRIKGDLEARTRKAQEDAHAMAETARRITAMEGVTTRLADGDFAARSEDSAPDDLGRIATALNAMGDALGKSFGELETKNWLQRGAMQIADAVRGEREVHRVAGKIAGAVAAYIEAPVATLYTANAAGALRLAGTYAATNAPTEIEPGQGLLGGVVQRGELAVTRELPQGYLKVASSVGEGAPAYAVALPLMQGGSAVGVLELGLLHEPREHELQFLRDASEPIGIALTVAQAYEHTQALLEETQAQAEELQAQHAELESINTELEAQSEKLQTSEEELRVQQEELQQTNAELEERSRALEERNLTITERNEEIQRQAEALAQSARYKSEFMANMSHELRTPLNSILLLSRLLADNKEGNLSDDQSEYARIIQSSGKGLLALIDEILDLSKIEAGKMTLEEEDVVLNEVAADMEALFKPVAEERGVSLHIALDDALPDSLTTDKMRLEQILKNLLSNALKFTREGSVSLSVAPEKEAEGWVAFTVRDTGIGIPEDKQALIFEAFQQADGSTRRKYGGTGLGLSISRELAKLLGGRLSLVSEVGVGSSFTLTLPLVRSEEQGATASDAFDMRSTPLPAKPLPVPIPRYVSPDVPESIPDDRGNLQPDDKVILIVEDDVAFARSLLDFTRGRGYKGVVAVRGDEGLELAKTLRPAGVLLDIELPVKNGWQVMDELKASPVTRPIPVHIMSSHAVKRESLQMGAVNFINKPFAFEGMEDVFARIERVLSGPARKVLIVEDNPKHASALAYYLQSSNINSDIKRSVAESVEALQNDTDCVILDMGIPDANGYATLEEIKKAPGLENLPVIVFTGKSLSLAEEQRIRKYADSIVVKTAHSYQRILDEVSLFLHLVEGSGAKPSAMTSAKTNALRDVLEGKTALIVDDDVRNIFSLTKALEGVAMKVVTAVDGKDALEQLRAHPDTDVVLLDMMMPQMDGYETATKIRENRAWQGLPVIAVTAKAMSGDRDKCIQAGASDYITKPIDIDQLISLLRVWLHDAN